jgi:hypothetical protein
MSSDGSDSSSIAAVDGCSDLTEQQQQQPLRVGSTTVHIITSSDGGEGNTAGDGAGCEAVANSMSIDSTEYV